MSNLLTPEADSVWMDQIFGLNYLTVSVLIGLLLIGILARFATMLAGAKSTEKNYSFGLDSIENGQRL